MRAITDQDSEEGFVEQLMVYTFPGHGRDKKKLVTLQGWIALTQEEWDNPASADLTPERQCWWHDIVKHPAPGQVYRFIYSPEKSLVRATSGMSGFGIILSGLLVGGGNEMPSIKPNKKSGLPRRTRRMIP